MTKPIPAGTVNTTVNLTREERLLLGKTAHDLGMSLAGLFRACLEHGLPRLSEDAARKLVEIRAEAAKVGVCLALLAGIGWQLACGTSDAVRGGSPGVRVVRVVKGGRRSDDWAGGEAFA